MVADTGAFRFSNTTPATLRLAADLRDHGADYPAVMDSLFFQEPLGLLRLGAALLESAELAYGGRLIYAVLKPELLEQFGVQPSETEDIIDVLRRVQGVEIACLIQPEPAHTRFSFRSRSPALSVADLARRLGGGGHHAAAGARIPAVPLPEAKQMLLDLTEKVFSA
ncbi:MAG: Bifunctional oligoribonuclease and PAP phosphatase NrnA [Lentisphaerae bacterium ADurb.BinA184]|nr:MAG: Bifunctional oligoribonuclease and PAP phosphatase NrnA [Lentisphaerae bacterium ADurb.BinA184]